MTAALQNYQAGMRREKLTSEACRPEVFFHPNNSAPELRRQQPPYRAP